MVMTPISVGEFLATRLAQLGAARLFGAAGIAGSALLDELCRGGALTWTESSSEPNAAFAADGFARTAGRPAAVLTHSHLGGLSTLLGLADGGASTAPVVVVAGLPAHGSTDVVPPSPDASLDRMSIATSILESSTAAAEIDRVLAAAMSSGRPAYLGVPLDVARAELDPALLDVPLRWSAPDPRPAPIRRLAASPTSHARSEGAEPIDLEVLWSEVAEQLGAGATVVADPDAERSGIPGLPAGSELVSLPPGAMSSALVPVALGAALARPDRRLVLAIGAETARPAIAELGRVLATGAPVVLVLEPAGRAEPTGWTWELIPAALGDRRVRVFSVVTVTELREALAAAAEGTRPIFVRVRLTHRVDVAA